jgi:hypothetical protein
MKVTVKYGLETYEITFAEQQNIGQLKTNTTLRAVLGFGDNVRALVGGVEIGNTSLVPDGATVVMETAANTKAAPN